MLWSCCQNLFLLRMRSFEASCVFLSTRWDTADLKWSHYCRRSPALPFTLQRWLFYFPGSCSYSGYVNGSGYWKKAPCRGNQPCSPNARSPISGWLRSLSVAHSHRVIIVGLATQIQPELSPRSPDATRMHCVELESAWSSLGLGALGSCRLNWSTQPFLVGWGSR